MTAQRQDTGTKRLSAGAVMVLKLIADWCAGPASKRRGGWACVSRRHIARLTRRSVRTVQRYIRDLRDAGEIEVQEQHADEGDRDWNLYRIPPVGGGGGDNSDSTPETTLTPPGRDNPDSTVETTLTPPLETRTLIGEHLIQQQQAQPAAAAQSNCSSESEPTPQAAQSALEEAGIPGPDARKFASADPTFCFFVLAFYRAEAAAKRRGDPLGVAFLRDCLNHPERHGLTEKDGAWTAPKGSMIYKNMRDAEKAWNAERAKAQAAQRQAELRARDEELRRLPDANAAAWSALAEADRRGIEAGVKREKPGLTPGGEMFLRQCYLRMKQFAQALADADQWNALADDQRQAIERDARAIFKLWAETEDGLRNACLTLMVSRAPAARTSLANPKGP